MKRSLYTSLLFITSILFASAQEGWDTYSAKAFLRQTAHFQDNIYVTSAGGLIHIDLSTKEEFYINRSNSNFVGDGTREIVMLDNGHMWLSGYFGDGIYYYDGERFTVHDEFITHDSLSNPRDLVADAETLWFRTGLTLASFSTNSYRDNFGSLWSYRDGIYTNHVDDTFGVDGFTLDNASNLWVVLNNQLSQYDGQTFSNSIPLPPIFNIPRTSVGEYFIDSKNNHWLGVHDAELDREYIWTYQENNWTEYLVPERITAFYEDSSKDLVFSTRDYIGSIDETILDMTFLTDRFPEVEEYINLRMQYYHEDLGHFLESENYIGENQFYQEKTNETIEEYIKNTDFLVPSVRDINQDCSGQIYAAGYGVLQEYKDDKWFNHLLPNDPTLDCPVQYVVTDPSNCQVWGYSSNCPFFWKLNTNERIDISPDGVREAFFDADGVLYARTTRNQVLQIDSVGSVKVLDGDTNSLFDAAFKIHIAADQSLWVIYFSSVYSIDIIDGEEVYYFDTPRIRQLKDDNWIEHPDNIAFENILYDAMIYEDNSNHIWINSVEALWKYDGTNWTEHTFDFIINDIAQDAEGNFWLATADRGLAYWDGNETIFYTVSNSGLWSNDCYELELINEEELWVRHNYGLTKVQLPAISDIKESKIENAFTVYPNPSSGPITIHNDSSRERFYQVYDLSGRQILSETSSDEKWTTFLQPGPYVVRVSTEEGSTVEKVIIAR